MFIFFPIDKKCLVFFLSGISPDKVKLWRNLVKTVRNFFCAKKYTVFIMGETVALRSFNNFFQRATVLQLQNLIKTYIFFKIYCSYATIFIRLKYRTLKSQNLQEVRRNSDYQIVFSDSFTYQYFTLILKYLVCSCY